MSCARESAKLFSHDFAGRILEHSGAKDVVLWPLVAVMDGSQRETYW
jgi:hypothetical protein